MNEYDVHFSLNGFFRRVEAESPEKAMETAEAWLTKARPELEKHARTGLGIEIVEAVPPEDTGTDPWADDPEWPSDEWRNDVSAGDTRLGYADWVKHNKEAAHE